jgi:hypothetical protein
MDTSKECIGDDIMPSRSKYEHPLVERYASKEMSFLWSPQKKFSTWRRLWLALAEGEQELGLSISEEQLEEMRCHLDDIDFDLAEEMEGKFRHDVMAVSTLTRIVMKSSLKLPLPFSCSILTIPDFNL